MSKAATGTDPVYMAVQTALEQGTRLLESAAVSAPRLTAEVLLSYAMNCDRVYLYAHASDSLTQLAWIHYGRYLDQRMKGKPTQYITHRQEFYGRDFYVDENVLIPRPETEHLVEKALSLISGAKPQRIWDLGTGSGAIAVSVSLETGIPVCASDVSPGALAVAQRNSSTHQARVQFLAADLLTAVAPASIDLLLSNPPYVPGADAANMQREVRDWEPHVALFASDDGFEIYRRLLAQAELAVKRGGSLVIELGYRSLEGVRQMLAARWTNVDVVADLAGWPRVISATLV